MSNQIELSFIMRELGNANSEVMKLMQASRRLAAEAKQSSTEAKRLNDQQIRDLKAVVDNIEKFDRAEKKSGTDFVRSMSEKANAVTKLAEAIHRLDRGGLGGELGKDLGGAVPHAGAVSAVTGGVLGGNRLQVPTTDLLKEISGLGAEFATLRSTLVRFGTGLLGAVGGVVAPGMVINAMVSGYKEEIDKSREMAEKWRQNIAPLAGMGSNPQNILQLKEDIRSRAAAYGIPQEEIIQAQLAVESGASHLPPETQEKILDQALMFSKGKGSNVIETAKMFVAVTSAYKDLAGDMGKASDLLGQASDQGKWMPSDLANYLPEVASVASAYKFPIEDLLAFLVAASKSSGKSEKTFTSARNILNKLPEAFKKGIIRPDENGQFTIAGAVSQFSTDLIPFFGLDQSAVIGGLAANPEIFTEAEKSFDNIKQNNAMEAYKNIVKNDAQQRQAELNRLIDSVHEKTLQELGESLGEEQINLKLARNQIEDLLPTSWKWATDPLNTILSYLDKGSGTMMSRGGPRSGTYQRELRKRVADEILKNDQSDVAKINAAALTGDWSLLDPSGATVIGKGEGLGAYGRGDLQDRLDELKRNFHKNSSLPGGIIDANVLNTADSFAMEEAMGVAGIRGTKEMARDLLNQAGQSYRDQLVVDWEKNHQWYRDLQAKGLTGNALQAAVDAHYAGLGGGTPISDIRGQRGRWTLAPPVGPKPLEEMREITPEERMSAQFDQEARRTRAKAAALRNQAAYLPWAKRGSFLEGVNADEREALQGIGKRYEKAMENTEWGISRKAQQEAVQEARDALVRRRVDMIKFGAKDEDELIEKMVLKMNDPNSFENKLKARTESMNKGVINITGPATINVTKANMGNAITGAADRNDRESKQPGM